MPSSLARTLVTLVRNRSGKNKGARYYSVSKATQYHHMCSIGLGNFIILSKIYWSTGIFRKPGKTVLKRLDC